MADLSQVTNLGRKSQDFLKTMQERQKKMQKPDTNKEEEQTAPSFQGAENLKEESDKLKQEKKDKLTTDSDFQKKQIEKFKADDSKASYKNTGELGFSQLGKSIKGDWQTALNNEKESFKKDVEKAKADDGKVGLLESARIGRKHHLTTTGRIAGRGLQTIVKGVLGVGDYVVDKVKRENAAGKAVVEAQKGGKLLTQEQRNEIYNKAYKEKKDAQINEILSKDIDEENSVKEVATDRLINNATILQNKASECETTINDVNQLSGEIAQLEAQKKQMDEDRKKGKVSGPERNTNYLATVNTLKSKKVSLEEKTNLLYQKLDEYDQFQKEHQLKEFELSPFTDNYYETEDEAQRYRSLFGDKLYKNEDGSIMSQGEQKDRDIYAVLKNLERVTFGAAEGVRDEYVGKISSLFGFKDDYNPNSIPELRRTQEYLKNSEKFLNLSYNAFEDIKQKLYQNYDSLCDTVVNQSGEEEKVLNQDKLAVFLKQNKAGLARMSDYILEATDGTKYMDIKFGRYQEGDEGWLLRTWKDAGGMSNLIWSMTTSESKEKTGKTGPFRYDKARDWINQATGNYGYGDMIRAMVLQNPAKTAYICGSMYFAVAGGGVYSMNPGKATQIAKLGKIGVLGKTNAKLAQATNGMLGIYSQTKRGVGVIKMAEGLSKLSWLTPTKSKFWNKMIDTTIRKGIGMLDEAYVSLPLDLGLNDQTERDLKMNIWFNALGGLGKIQSMSDLRLFSKTLTSQGDAAAMEKYFVKHTGLEELAKTVNWQGSADEIIEQAEGALNFHIDNLLSTDTHKAAWFMTQYINKNIDSLKREQMDEVEAASKAIVDNGNIGASISKNRAKNISQAIAEGKAKIAKAKNGANVLTIQNTTVAKVKKEFSAMLSSFDVEKLNKLYKRKFSADRIGQGFANFMLEWERATGVPKEDLMLIFIDSMNTRVGKEGASVVDLFNQRVVQGLSDGSIKSSKGAKEGVKGARGVAKNTKDSMGKILDITTVLEKDPDKAANILSDVEERWLHDTKESLKGLSPEEVAIKEKEIAEDYEKTVAKINASKEEKIKNAEIEGKSLTERLKEKNVGLEGEQKELKDKGADIIGQAETVSKNPKLQEKLAKAEEEYIKTHNVRNVEEELGDYLKEVENDWRKMYEEDAEEEGLTLEEYLEKNNLEFEGSLQQKNAIETFYRDNFGMSSVEYAKAKDASMFMEGFPVEEKRKVVEEFLEEEYGMPFSEKSFKAELNNLKIEKQAEVTDIWKDNDNFFPEKAVVDPKKGLDMQATSSKEAVAISEKLKPIVKKKKLVIQGDLNSLTDTEKTTLEGFLKKYGVEGPFSEETLAKTYDIMMERSDRLLEEIGNIDDMVVKNVRNPYKRFSNAIINYLTDAGKVNPNAANLNGGKIASTSLENQYLKLDNMTEKEKKILGEDYDKILEKLSKSDTKTKIESEASQLADEAQQVSEAAIKEAEEAAKKELADAEQMKLSLTENVKKRGLSQRVIDGVDKILDFFQNNVNIVKKTGILDTTRKIAKGMDDITQKVFLGTLGDIIDSLTKGDYKGAEAMLENLGKTVFDGWSTSFKKGIVSDVKKAIKASDGGTDVIKLQDFAGDLYNVNKTKRENQLAASQVDDVVKDLIQKKVTQNMAAAIFDKGNITAEKAANEIASDVIANTTTKIKDPVMAKLNQKLGKQSTDAMILYQKAVDTAALKRGDVAEELAEQTAIKEGQDAVSGMSAKRRGKEKKANNFKKESYLKKVDELIENEEATKTKGLGGMDERLAKSIQRDEKNAASLSQRDKNTERVVGEQRLTEKEKTLLRFGAKEEAMRIMAAISKGEDPGFIKAEFLDGEGFALLNKLFDWQPDEGKEYEMFVKAFIDSRNKTQSFGYQIFHSLKNILYNGEDSLKMRSGKFNFNDILEAIPGRVTSNIKGKDGGILYDPRVTITKYIMENNPEEGAKIIKGALTDYFRTALAKDSRAELGRNFLEAFDKQASSLEAPEVVAEEFMNLYNKISKRLSGYGVDDKAVQDILNPMFYNPLEYIRGIAKSSHPEIHSVLKGQAMEDMVVGTVLKKYLGQGNTIPEELMDLYIDTKNWAKSFEKFAGGSIIRNKNAMEFGDALGAYFNKLDSLPIGREQFADWMNKTLSHIVHLGDDVTRKVTVYESLLSPLYTKARKALSEKGYEEFMDTVVDKFLFSTDGGLKKTKELQEGVEDFVKSLKDNDLYDDEVAELIDVLKRSFEAKESGESRVLTNFLYDRASKNADEYMKQTGKTPDKFTPADIMERKTLQEIVMAEYEQKSTEELMNQITTSERKYKELDSKSGKMKSIENSKQNIKRMTESYGIDAEEAKDIDTLLSNEDIDKLLKDGELSPEAAMKQVLKRITTNKETFEKLMAENGFFKNRVDDSLQKVFNEKEMKAGEEYFSVGKNGEFVLRQKAEEYNWLQRFAAQISVKGHIMGEDKETQSILAGVDKTRQTAYVHNNIDFGTILSKKDMDLVGKNISLESYISMGKTSVYKLAKKIKAADRDNIIAEAVNRIFRGTPSLSMNEKMADPAAKEMVKFLEKYKEGIDKTRKTLELGDQWRYVFEGTDFSTKGVGANKLANRISGMWNYLSIEDIARLSSKYDKNVSSAALWSDFTKNIIYNARADLKDSAFMRGLEYANRAGQKYTIIRNYNVSNITKAGQQVVSNLYHSQGILRSVSVAGTSEFDKLYDFFRTSTMRNLGFDIFESEGKYGERIFEKGDSLLKTTANPLGNVVTEANKGEKGITVAGTKYRLKDGNIVKNFVLFGKDLITSNALMRGDRATQKWAVKSSLALAIDETYRLGGPKAVENFTENIKKFNDLLQKYGLRERDLMDADRFFTKATQTLNSKRAMEAVGFSPSEVHKYYIQNKKDMKFIHDFYRNEYAPFMGKARTSMGTFFVADNIKELGSIQAIDKHKYMFGLMKWSTGKIGEYLFDVGSAFNKFKGTKHGFFEAFRSPIFKRLFSELTEGARGMWEIEKLTNDEFTWEDGMKATIVPVAAMSMLIGESIVDWAQKTFSGEERDKGGGEFTKHVILSSLDAAADFVSDRALIYLGTFGSDIGGAVNTASAVGLEDSSDFREAFATTRWRKFFVNNPMYKFTHIRSAGYETSATELIKPETILAEIGLNQTSSARETLNDINTNIYDLQKNYYNSNDKWYTTILNYVPIIKNAKQAGKDMGVLLPMFDGKVEVSGAKGFLKQSTSRSELARLINNLEKNVMLEKDDFKTWAMNNVRDVNALSDDELKTAMIKAGVYTDDLKAWDIIQKGLAKENASGKGESMLRLTTLDEEDRNTLFEEFNNMYQTYVIDKGKADVATTSMFDKFVLAATKYGGSISMVGYMGAYATAYKAAAREYYGLKSAEVTAGNKGEEWLAAEESFNLKDLPESKYGNYIRYVDDIRSFEQAFIVDNRDILSRERSIGIDLLNTYIENDKENFGWHSYLGSIGDEKSNMSKLWNTLNYNQISKDQGLPGMIVPLAYQEKKAADGYTLMLSKAKTPEDVASIGMKFLNIQKELAGLADNFVESPQAAGLVKASLTSGLVSFAEKIEEKSPGMLKKVVDIVGEKAINDVLNTLTDSPTVTMADAFEIATKVSAHPGSGGKGKYVSIPSAKGRENYVTKMLIPNYNKAKAVAAATGGGDVDLPNFTTGYGRAKDGSIITVKIPVATRKTVRDLPTNSIDTKTAKLDVAPLPVKEGRVIGGKYSARAIQNAKVYSRRIGR